jgi:hypothetical protein
MQACEAAKRCARQRRWYPKNVLVAVVLFVAFGLALDSSVDFKRGAAVGVLALAAYLGLDTFLTFNPAQWRRHR